jgi:hypothetical protein
MQQQQWIETTTNNAGVGKGGYISWVLGGQNEVLGGPRPKEGQSNPFTWHRVEIRANTV